MMALALLDSYDGRFAAVWRVEEDVVVATVVDIIVDVYSRGPATK